MLTQNKGRKRRNAGRNEPGCDGSFQDHGSKAQQSGDGMAAVTRQYLPELWISGQGSPGLTGHQITQNIF